MKSNLSAVFLLTAIFAAFYQAPAKSQPEMKPSENTSTTVVAERYQWKSDTLVGQVEEAIEQGEQNYIGPVIALMESHRNNPDEVLQLLKPHLRNANETTQDTIIAAASLAQTKQALEILSSLTTDANNGRYAAIAIYENFDCQQLNSWGGSQLENSLFRAAFKRRDVIETYLLLSCFEVDRGKVDFLNKRRKSFNTENKKKVKTAISVDRSQEIIALDLALVEMGDTDALLRVVQLLTQSNGNEEKLQSLLRYLKFVKNKKVLRQTIDLLKNTNVVIKIRTPEGTVNDTIRVCDLAFFSLSKRADVLPKRYQNLDETSLPHFSTEELAQAYERFRVIFNV